MTETQRQVVNGPDGSRQSVVTPVDRDPEAAVLVIQEMWGVTDHLLSYADNLATRGYLAVVPHLYHRAGQSSAADLDQARVLLRGLAGAGIEADVRAATDLARQSGATQIGVVGFCMGGTVALWAAARAGVDAAVTFYGGGVSASRWDGIPAGVELAREVRVPWLGLYGEQDPSIPAADLDALAAVFADNPVAADIVRYPEAGHAFATDPSSPARVESAAMDGWARAVTWFEAYLPAT